MDFKSAFAWYRTRDMYALCQLLNQVLVQLPKRYSSAPRSSSFVGWRECANHIMISGLMRAVWFQIMVGTLCMLSQARKTGHVQLFQYFIRETPHACHSLHCCHRFSADSL
eukprot:6480661-Amphidinium_carterae.2